MGDVFERIGERGQFPENHSKRVDITRSGEDFWRSCLVSVWLC